MKAIKLKCAACGFGWLEPWAAEKDPPSVCELTRGCTEACETCEGRETFDVVLSTGWEHQLAVGLLVAEGRVRKEDVRAAVWDLFGHEELSYDTFRTITSIANNPCCWCGTYRLDQEMFGSAYCSVQCMNDAACSKDAWTAECAQKMQACIVDRELENAHKVIG